MTWLLALAVLIIAAAVGRELYRDHQRHRREAELARLAAIAAHAQARRARETFAAINGFGDDAERIFR